MNGIWPVFQPSPAQAQNIREKTEAVFRLFLADPGCCRIGPHRLGTGYAGQCANDSTSRPCRQSPDHRAGWLRTESVRVRPVNSLPVRWTGYLTRRRASVLPLLPVRFCALFVTPWSLLPARYGTLDFLNPVVMHQTLVTDF